MVVVVTTGAIRRQCHHQQTNIRFLKAGCPFLLPNQQYQCNEGKDYSFFSTAEILCVSLFKLLTHKISVVKKPVNNRRIMTVNTS